MKEQRLSAAHIYLEVSGNLIDGKRKAYWWLLNERVKVKGRRPEVVREI
jgi:hypothetical protein